MSFQRLDQANAGSSALQLRERRPVVSAEEALRELFELLEDYAPSWYTKEHHERAIAALRLS